jgi:hypothetical protein
MDRRHRYSAKDGAFTPEKPRVWLDKVGGTAWDLSPDGKRLLVLAPAERHYDRGSRWLMVAVWLDRKLRL